MSTSRSQSGRSSTHRARLLRQGDVLPDVVAQPFSAVPPQDEPQLERAEPPAQRHLPVAVVDDGAGLAGRVAQVLRHDRQRRDQRLAVRDVEGVQSKLVNSHLCGSKQ